MDSFRYKVLRLKYDGLTTDKQRIKLIKEVYLTSFEVYPWGELIEGPSVLQLRLLSNFIRELGSNKLPDYIPATLITLRRARYA